MTNEYPDPSAPATSTGRKPRRFKTLRRVLLWILAAFVALIIVIIIVGSMNGGNESAPDDDTTAAAPATPSESTATPDSTPAPEETTMAPSPTDQATAADDEEDTPTEVLSSRVSTAALEANAVSSFQELQATSPGFWIADIEDVSTGTVRVYLQEEFTDAEQENTARWLANMTCQNVEDLETIVTQDTTGLDKNYYLRDLDILPACK